MNPAAGGNGNNCGNGGGGGGNSNDGAKNLLLSGGSVAASIASKTPPTHHHSAHAHAHATMPNQGIATPHPKTTARIQAATPAATMFSQQPTLGGGGGAVAGPSSSAGGGGAGGSAPPATTCQSVAPQLIAANGAVVLGGGVGGGAGGPSTVAAVVAPSGSGPGGGHYELLSAFECPVCLDYMVPPYLQCQSGHLLCGVCRPKVNCCPTCRGAVPSIRNLAMEKIANNLQFPCKFAHAGCSQYLVHSEKIEHEEGCEYRPYLCPCPGASCKWQGNLIDVMGHLMKLHKSITTLQGEDIVFLATDINLPGAVDWVMMQACFGCYFMLVLEKQDKQEQSGQNYQMFYAVVQLIGNKKEAENFSYRLELSNQRRRLCWEATPRSIHEGVSTAISQSDCLSFDTNHAQLFAENGNLGINVTISNINQMNQI